MEVKRRQQGEGEWDPEQHPHRRMNALTGEWMLVSPHRTKVPWQGSVEAPPPPSVPQHDPGCYLCPGNKRAKGDINPKYEGCFVFTNDFPALLPSTPAAPEPSHPLLQADTAKGTCRVVCFSPRHDLTVGSLALSALRTVIDKWAEETSSLGKQFRWIQVFENRGTAMGASNPHPHCQIWCTGHLPSEVLKEGRTQREHLQSTGTPLLLEYARVEQEKEERVVMRNDHWMVLVPYWAVWPFETLLIPLAPVSRLPELTGEQRDSLAEILRRLAYRYDRVFGVPFPLSMGWHGAPFADGGGDDPDFVGWQLHAHFYPPLLLSAEIRKWMVGFEMLAESQRDFPPEHAARRLRNLPDPPSE